MTESNLITRRIVTRTIMKNFGEKWRRRRRRRMNCGWRNIMIGDANLTGRMIQTMTEEMLLMKKYFITFRLIPFQRYGSR